ncbi:hypothetical protein AMTRI_Chr03g142090 [Amborella trichopoda]
MSHMKAIPTQIPSLNKKLQRKGKEVAQEKGKGKKKAQMKRRTILEEEEDVDLEDTREEYFKKGYQEQNPHVKSMRDIGKACGVKWKAMSYEEKVEYYDIATEKRAEFEKAMAAYVERRESGEYDED